MSTPRRLSVAGGLGDARHPPVTHHHRRHAGLGHPAQRAYTESVAQ